MQMADHDAHQTGAIGARFAVHENGKFDLLQTDSLIALKLGAARRGARSQPQVGECDTVAGTCLLLEPARSVSLFVAAQVDDRLDARLAASAI